MNKQVIELDLTVMRQFTLNKYINAERQNRFSGAKMKKMATMYCKRQVELAMAEGLQFTWPCKLKLDWYLPDGRIDPDNWDFCKKYLQDGMQKAMYEGDAFLENDSIKFIVGYDSDFAVDKEHPRLEIGVVE
ncbi:hypothetical protein PT274_01525 [Leuconostocaceae bacterium ESL0958]|nr:hypothetical protein [Leuconostocaceae bacterium ESL0958]